MSIEKYYTETVKVITITEPANHSTALRTESCSTISAAINPKTGDDYTAQGQNFPHADYKLFCRSTVSITESNQVSWGGKRFDVVFVKDTFNMAHHNLVLLQTVIN